jgi:phytoene dehydrogenase-like protein
LLYVGLGVNRSFDDEPKTISGMTFPLRKPAEVADQVVERMPVHIYNQDPTLAPPGKTSLVVMMPSSYAYWRELADDRAAYEEKKEQVARTVVALLDQRFPGLSDKVEMVDVATPLTWERYTGNWKGSFEGWMVTPENAYTMMKPLAQTLPGLANFYMSGQWVEPGGGLPSGVSSGRRLVKELCKEDGAKFQTTRVQ